MVAFNFKKEFAPEVEAGSKSMTIRAKQRAKVGDRLQLYTGMRTKACRLLGEATCTGLAAVTVTARAVKVDPLDGDTPPAEALPQLDGFKSKAAFIAFFKAQYGLPFEGVLHVWQPLDPRRLRDRYPTAQAQADPEEAERTRREHMARSADMCGERWLETGNPWPEAGEAANDNQKPRPWVQLFLPCPPWTEETDKPEPKTAKEA